MRVAIYCRVSTREQAKGDSVAAQERGCRDYCESQGWEIAGVWHDDGVSGELWDKRRPALFELYRKLPQLGIEKIVVRDIHRPARGTSLPGKLRWDFAERGVTFIAYEAPDLDPCETAQQQANVAGYMRAISRMAAAGRRRVAERSTIPIWKAPYGFERVPAFKEHGKQRYTFKPVPEQAAVIRKMYELYLGGERVTDIAQALGEGWSVRRVRESLSNPAYAGGWLFKRREVRERNPQEKAVSWGMRAVRDYREDVVWGAWEPIVDRKTWDQAAKLIIETSDAARKHRTFYGRQRLPLSGLLVCGRCGQFMSKNGRNPHKPLGTGHYYSCPALVTSLKARAKPCPGIRIPVWGMLPALALQLVTQLAGGKVAELILEERLRMRKQEDSPSKLGKRIAKLRAEEKKLVRAIRSAAGGPAVEVLTGELNGVGRDIKRLEGMRKRAERERTKRPTLADVRAELAKDRQKLETAAVAYALGMDLESLSRGKNLAGGEFASWATEEDRALVRKSAAEHAKLATKPYTELERHGHPLIRKWVKRVVIHADGSNPTVELGCGETFELHIGGASSGRPVLTMQLEPVTPNRLWNLALKRLKPPHCATVSGFKQTCGLRTGRTREGSTFPA